MTSLNKSCCRRQRQQPSSAPTLSALEEILSLSAAKVLVALVHIRTYIVAKKIFSSPQLVRSKGSRCSCSHQNIYCCKENIQQSSACLQQRFSLHSCFQSLYLASDLKFSLGLRKVTLLFTLDLIIEEQISLS